VKEDNSVVSLSYSTRREKIEIQFTTAHIKPISKLLEKLQKMAKQEKKLHQKNLEAELAKINEELNPI
ncbi:MAG TPA: hypothetical protein DCE56_02230, partial [Cyanobacteria bacterium UBA8553]|nr:hypothetical protein [Cyanobacteria bacterium UBA8553]